MSLQDIYYISGSAGAIIITLIVILKSGLNFGSKRYYKIDTYEWESITSSITSSQHKFERIDERLKQIENKADIKKKKY